MIQHPHLVELFKLFAHPFLVGIMHFIYFTLSYAAAVMVITASLPVGNTFLLAQHYKIDSERISAAILLSTLFSALTVTFTIALVLEVMLR